MSAPLCLDVGVSEVSCGRDDISTMPLQRDDEGMRAWIGGLGRSAPGKMQQPSRAIGTWMENRRGRAEVLGQSKAEGASPDSCWLRTVCERGCENRRSKRKRGMCVPGGGVSRFHRLKSALVWRSGGEGSVSRWKWRLARLGGRFCQVEGFQVVRTKAKGLSYVSRDAEFVFGARPGIPWQSDGR